MLHRGVVVAQRFTIEARIGAGGMGVVYRAADAWTGTPVALKVLRADPEGLALQRFLREAKLLVALAHPSIVRYVDHGATDDGEIFLAMEMLEGEDLHERIRRAPLTLAEAVEVVTNVARAVGYAHESGVVHRDLKPRNIFLEQGSVKRVKVLDFGVAFAHGGTIIATGSEIVGTPGFMAPEQARGDASIDARADVFSLGCILFHAVTGHPPFSGADILAALTKLLLEDAPRLDVVREDVPHDLGDLCAAMLSKDRDARVPSMDAAVDRLLALDLPADVAGARAGATRPAITAHERAHIAVVLALPPGDASLDEEAVESAGASARSLFGARLERSQGGALALVISSATTAADDAVAAVRCAEHLRTRLGPWTFAVALGRGVVTGGLPVGDVIDRAVSALRVTPAGSIGLDETSASLAEAHFDLGDVGTGDVPSGVRLVLSDRSTMSGARTLLGRRMRCVGREREVSSLYATLAECVDEGVARAVVLTGPPGIGKTRIATELFAREGNLEVWVSRGEPMSAGSPFCLVADILRSGLGVNRALGRDEQWAQVADGVGRLVDPASASRVTIFLCELLELGVPLAEVTDPMLRAARQNPVQMGDLMLRAFEDLVVARLARGPLVLFLEDLHWADVPSLRYISALLRFAKDGPLFVLGVARPEAHTAFPAFFADRAVSEMRLTPLGKKAAARLVSEALAGTALDPQEAQGIVERAEGNVFFLEELIRAVASGRRHAGLPETVLATVEARLRELSAEARLVLRAASVFGQRFWLGGLASLLGDAFEGKSAGRLASVIRKLEEQEVCTHRAESRYADETEYEFRHALVRDAAYAALTDEDKALGHRLAASWLEETGERDASLLAEHYERGGNAVEAVHHYELAASQALEGNDFNGVIERATRGLDLGAEGAVRTRLLLMTAEAHQWTGDSENALRRAREVLAAGDSAGLVVHFRALSEGAAAAGRLGNTGEVLDLAAHLAGANFDRDSIVAYVEALAVVLSRLVFMGFNDKARDLAAHIDALPPAAREDHACIAHIHRATAVFAQINLDLSADIASRRISCEAFDEIGDFRQAVQQRINLGNCYVQVGALELAERELRAALALAERMHLLPSIANAKSNLGHALLLLGLYEESERVEREACEMFERQRSSRLESASRAYLAGILLARGDFAGAADAVERALEIAPSDTDRAFALAERARIRLGTDDVSGALEDATAALQTLDELGGIDEGEIAIRVVYAEALFAAGRGDEAMFATRFAYERLDEQLDKITDPELRHSCATRVPENARLRALVEQQLGE